MGCSLGLPVVHFEEGSSHVGAEFIALHQASNNTLSKAPMRPTSSLWATTKGTPELDKWTKDHLHGMTALLADTLATSDLSLLRVLDSGAMSSLVVEGWWRSATPCAIKLILSPCEGGLPSRVVSELTLARMLSHPHIVSTYDVRCCQLTSTLVGPSDDSFGDISSLTDALIVCTAASAPNSTTAAPVEAAAASPDTPPGGDPAEQPPGSVASTAPATPVGLAPSSPSQHGKRARAICAYLAAPTPGAEHAAAFSAPAAPSPADGSSMAATPPYAALGPVPLSGATTASTTVFDDDKTIGSGPSVSWRSVLHHMGAQPGDYLTIMVMQHARLGTLASAISMGVFHTRPRQQQQQQQQQLLRQGLQQSAREQPRAEGEEQQKRLAALLASAREIALGLEYLHASKVVYGDLKPANILLQDSRADARGFTCLLSDFGLSVLQVEGAPPCKSTQGTLPYMSPELMSAGLVTPASDVYAFGMTLWEMACSSRAYAGATKGHVVSSVLRGDRPPWVACDTGVMAFVKQVYLRCVAAQPQARPTATQLVQIFAALEQVMREESE